MRSFLTLIVLALPMSATAQQFVPLETPRDDDITEAVFGQVEDNEDHCPGTPTQLWVAEMLSERSSALSVHGRDLADIYACFLRIEGQTLRQFRGTFEEFGAASDRTVLTLCEEALYYNEIWQPGPPRRMPNLAKGYCVPESMLDKLIYAPSLGVFNMRLLAPTNHDLTFQVESLETIPLPEAPWEGAGRTGFIFHEARFTIVPDEKRKKGEISPPLFVE